MEPMQQSDDPNHLESQCEKSAMKARIRSVRDVKSPKGLFNYVQETFNALSQTIEFLIAIALGSIIPIAMLVVGVIYKDKCPIQPYIAIYMIVAGVFGIVKSALKVLNLFRLRRFLQTENDQTVTFKGCDILNSVDSLITWFLFAWFIAGCVWVFGNAFPEFSDTNSAGYCDKGLFIFAFVILIISWLLVLLLVSVCCCCCLMCCVATCGVVLSATDDGPQAEADTQAEADPKAEPSEI